MAEMLGPYELGRVHQADCLGAMAQLPDVCVDSVVTDPPYGLSFMGKDWDHGIPGVAFWAEALRVAKPGAHLLAFGGTRTFHRLACAIEDAGWEIRDCLSWLYGQGFPKSLDVSKAIYKAAGVKRDNKFAGCIAAGDAGPTGNKRCEKCGKWLVSGNPCRCPRPQDDPVSDDARQWSGWGTALKPAWEPIIVARKPLDGTVAHNVQAHCTGAINVDGCRIGAGKRVPGSLPGVEQSPTSWSKPIPRPTDSGQNPNVGRWPANLVLDEEAAAMLDEQSGPMMHSAGFAQGKQSKWDSAPADGWGTIGTGPTGAKHGDTGGASRFFYCAKASRSERGEGNRHPTVKPLSLMRWLCRLVTPPGGIVLDPFSGSGTTGCSAKQEDLRFIGFEQDERYAGIANARIASAVERLGEVAPSQAKSGQQSGLFAEVSR